MADSKQKPASTDGSSSGSKPPKADPRLTQYLKRDAGDGGRIIKR